MSVYVQIDDCERFRSCIGKIRFVWRLPAINPEVNNLIIGVATRMEDQRLSGLTVLPSIRGTAIQCRRPFCSMLIDSDVSMSHPHFLSSEMQRHQQPKYFPVPAALEPKFLFARAAPLECQCPYKLKGV